MADMNLNAEVLIRLDGHEELYSIGTIDVPINITFGAKPTLGHKPGYRGAEVTNVKVDGDALGRNVEALAAKRGIR